MCDRPSVYSDLVNELRCRETAWLRARRVALVREQRRLHTEELAVLQVLDERHRVDAMPGESARKARDKLETARRLESTPDLADTALRGDISDEQLTPVAQLATPETSADWAERAPNISPLDLRRMERARRLVTPADEDARREARELRWWMREDAGMLSLRGEIPGVDGVLVKQVLDHIVEHTKPAKGERWDTYAHRGADALVQLCREHVDDASGDPVVPARPRVVVNVDPQGHADVEGVPISQATVARMLEDAIVEAVFWVDGAPFAYGPGRTTIPDRLRRAIYARDRHCRVPGCERTTGLVIHHLISVCEGGLTEPGNLCLVCEGGSSDHHRQLNPHGRYRLVGNPNEVDGLQLIGVGDLARAGPAP
jgi:hypothetical protein